MRNGKRIISFLLSAALLLTCIPWAATARAATGQCGENLTYTDHYNPNTSIWVKTVISGTGPMYNYNVEDPGFYLAENISPFMANVAEVVIEEGATTIGRGAFCYRQSLKSVTIPKSVTAIEYGAFYASHALENVYYGGSEADWAKITVGSRNDELNNATMHYNCDVPSGEEESVLGGECGDAVTWTLNQDTGLLTISGTGDMCDYGKDASERFAPWHEKGVKRVVVEEGVTSLAIYAFFGCDTLTHITLPSSLTRIGEAAFYGCSNLEEILLPENLTEIGESAFMMCDSLREVTIPEGVTNIARETFYSCDNLTDIALPNTVTTIGGNAFSYCGMTEITIPDSVKSIYAGAFSWCPNLTDITLPDSITNINSSTFYGCSKLTGIQIPESVYRIGAGAFSNSGLVSIDIPNSVTTIEEEAFAGCTNLSHIALPDGITEIGQYMLAGCTTLKEVRIPEGVTNIGLGAFRKSANLTTVIIPESVTTVDQYAFDLCDGLTDVYYAGDETQWKGVRIGSNNTSLKNAAVHYNSTGPEEAQVYSDLRYYYGWNEKNQRAYFGPRDVSGCLVTQETDSAFREDPSALVGKYVAIEYMVVDGEEILLTMTEVPGLEEAKPYPFRFTGNLAADRDVESTCYYTDGYFLQDAELYNAHLATMSLCFELTTWSRSLDSGAKWSDECNIGRVTNHRAQNAYDLLVTQLGFESFRLNDAWQTTPSKDSIGAVAASRMLPDGSRLIALGVRGGGYTQEWASNFTVGKTGDHAGFAEARDTVLAFLEDYINDYQITGPIKLWVVGYSRGGCVANMVAGTLNNNPDRLTGVTLDHSDLYCYTFAAPQGALESYTAKGDHSNIHNTINLNDMVPLVAPSDWGFDRYSTDRYLPSAATSANFVSKYAEMIPFFYDFIEVDDGVVKVPEYGVKEVCRQYQIEIQWENWKFGGEPLATTRVHFVPMATVLRESTDFIFKSLAGDRETYYMDLQAGVRTLLALIKAEDVKDALDSDSKTLSVQEFLDILLEELIEKERIFEIVEPMYAFNLDSYEERVEKVRENLETFLQEVLNNSDLAGTAIFIANLKDTLTDILWRALETTLKDLANKDTASLKAMINFATSLESVKRAHFSEVMLSWLMSQDSYYNAKTAEPEESGAPQSRVVRINCPVDVRVYRADTGQLVAAIIDDAAQDIEGSSIYAYLTTDGEKTVILPADAEYTVEITATADGTFNYSVSEYNWEAQKNARILSYRDIPIAEGDAFESVLPEFTEEELSDETPSGSSAAYTLQAENGNTIEPDDEFIAEEAAEAAYTVNVTSNIANGSISGGGIYTHGSFAQVTATPMPDQMFLGWYQDGVLVSQDAEYRFAVVKDTELVAGFTDYENPRIDLEGTAMTLGDSLSVDFVVDVSKLDADGAYAIVTKTYADGREPVSVQIPREDWKHHSGDLYYFSFQDVAAKEMCDRLTAVVFDTEGVAIANPYSDSIRDYAMRMLDKEEVIADEALRTLYVDMLNYGAAAQTQFDYDVQNLANSSLTDEQLAWATVDCETKSVLEEGPGRAGTTLTLKSRITLDFLFDYDVIGTVLEGCYAVVTYTDHYGKPVQQRIDDFYDYDSLCCYVSVPGLSVADYSTVVTCTVYNAEGQALAWATDSIEGYAHRMADRLPETVESIVKFGASAYHYFRTLEEA